MDTFSLPVDRRIDGELNEFISKSIDNVAGTEPVENTLPRNDFIVLILILRSEAVDNVSSHPTSYVASEKKYIKLRRKGAVRVDVTCTGAISDQNEVTWKRQRTLEIMKTITNFTLQI